MKRTFNDFDRRKYCVDNMRIYKVVQITEYSDKYYLIIDVPTIAFVLSSFPWVLVKLPRVSSAFEIFTEISDPMTKDSNMFVRYLI